VQLREARVGTPQRHPSPRDSPPLPQIPPLPIHARTHARTSHDTTCARENEFDMNPSHDFSDFLHGSSFSVNNRLTQRLGHRKERGGVHLLPEFCMQTLPYTSPPTHSPHTNTAQELELKQLLAGSQAKVRGVGSTRAPIKCSRTQVSALTPRRPCAGARAGAAAGGGTAAGDQGWRGPDYAVALLLIAYSRTHSVAQCDALSAQP
jgi:hypothetical protein